MTVTTWTLTGDVSTMIGDDWPVTGSTAAEAYLTAYDGDGPCRFYVDTSTGGKVRFGPTIPVTLASDGTFTVAGIPDSSETGLSYTFTLTYRPAGHGRTRAETTDRFTLDANKALNQVGFVNPDLSDAVILSQAVDAVVGPLITGGTLTNAAVDTVADERVALHTADPAAAHAASAIFYAGSSGLTADDVEAALDELDTIVDAKAGDRRVAAGGGAPGADAVNVVSGHADNAVASDISAATIGGGGDNNYNNVIGGDGSATVNTSTPNATSTGTNANYSTIDGGYDNVAGGLASSIRGHHNYTALGTTHGSINGGSVNKITKPGASNDYSTIGGGTANEASGGTNTISGGSSNVASGTGATIGGGVSNTASGNQACIPGGANNQASATSSVALGNRAVAREGGQVAQATTMFAAAGDQQTSVRVAGLTTTDATVTTFQMEAAFPVSSSQVYSCHLVAREPATGDTKAWRIDGVLRRGSSGAVVEVGGAPTPTALGADAGASTWAVATLGGTGTMNLRVTGQAAKTIRWVARFEFTEVAG